MLVLFHFVQLHSSSSDEAISSRTEKQTPAEELSSRTSVEIQEEVMERVKKAQQKIQLVNHRYNWFILSMNDKPVSHSS